MVTKLKKKNKYAKDLFSIKYKPRVIKPKKGKGSFNRKNLTFNSIGQLHRDLYPKNIKLIHYLVDDCSDDGTSELINKSFNDVKIIKTSGDLYWSRSMKLGWDYIKKEIYLKRK